MGKNKIFFSFWAFWNIIYSVRSDYMLKLNNRGWGLSVLIAFLVVLILAIILVSIGAHNLGID